MPQRFLRPGITRSEKWNSISWEAQSLFIRIMTLVDDHGRYDAHPQLLCSMCFPMGDPKGHQISVTAFAALCGQLSAKSLVHFYEIEGKKYLQVLKWQERIRSESHYPQHLLSDVGGILPPKPEPLAISHSQADSKESLNSQNTKKSSFQPETLKIPSSLDSVAFKAAWGAWVQFRLRLKAPRTSWEEFFTKQLGSIAEWGETAAIASIRASLLHEWLGLFEPKNLGRGNGETRPTTKKRMSMAELDALESGKQGNNSTPPSHGNP